MIERSVFQPAFISRRPLIQGLGAAAVAAGLWPSFRVPAIAADKVIQLMSWEGYDFPGPLAEWKKANGVEVQSTYMGSHDDIQAKILGGGGAGLDLITYGSSYKQLYAALKILQPIDESKIPNLKNLLPFFASNVQNIWVNPDGTRTGVPCDWGAVGISYDSSVIPQAPSSYDILFDPK
jgi:spermidine/putrescine transport system substrate-binding protein